MHSYSSSMRRRHGTVAFALAAVTLTPTAYAASVTVNTTQDAVAVDGKCSLREAISSVNKQAASGNMTGECAAGDGNDDTIVVPGGTYALSIAGADEDNNASGDLDIRVNVTIQGAGPGATIIDANSIDRVIDIPVAAITVRLNDLSLVNGHAPDSAASLGESGGGIHDANGADLYLTRVELANNRSGDGASGSSSAFSGGEGGAIFASGGTLVLSSCSVHDNRSGNGGSVSDMFGDPAGGGNGGALASHGTSVGIELTSLDHNQTGDGGTGGMIGGGSSGFGGGMYANGGSLTVLQSAFDSNHTGSPISGGSSPGGGLFVYNVVSQLTETSLTRNAAFDGGGIASGDSPLTLGNVTISGNYAGQFGGGLFVFGGSGQLNFVTLSANQAGIDSGGLRLEFGNSGAATLSFRNSILSGNTAPSLPECDALDGNPLTSQGYNLAGSGCPANAVGDVATNNPHLGALGGNGGIGLTQMPAPVSAAVDGGNCLASNTSVDERSHARFVDVPRAPNAADACDIGAAELDDDIFWNGFD